MASVLGRWKLFRPTIEPKPPPSAMPRISSMSVSTLSGPSREDHDAAPVERRLHHVPDPIRQRCDRNAFGLVDLARGVLLDVIGRRLYLDHVRAELRGDLRGIGHNVDRGFALPSKCPSRADTTRRPPRDPRLWLPRSISLDLLVHLVAQARARVDREADGRATEAQRIIYGTRNRRAGIRQIRQADPSCSA